MEEDDMYFVEQLRAAIEGTVYDRFPVNELKSNSEGNPEFPHVVAIGPRSRQRRIMSESDDMQYVERFKMGYLKAFLNRTKMNLETCVRAINQWESRAYEFYDGHHDLDYAAWFQTSLFDYRRLHLQYKEIFLLDSCFIIEVIWRYTCTRVGDETDYLSMPKIILDARRDMILPINQLPFFLLEGLFEFAFPSSDRSFIELSIIYLSEFMLIADSSQALESIHRRQQPTDEIKDFVDLLRVCHAPSVPRQPPAHPSKLIAMRKATELNEAGMFIRPSLTAIQYSRGLLQIPKIKINNKSEFVLKILIQRELQEHQYDTYIIDYLHFMDGLIDTGKDVDVLVQNEVIENFLRDSKSVATLFNGITAKATLYTPNYYYYGTCENLNAYCKVRYNRWRATLKRDYCSSPWMIASTIAAVILLILTLIQTVCSIISIT